MLPPIIAVSILLIVCYKRAQSSVIESAIFALLLSIILACSINACTLQGCAGAWCLCFIALQCLLPVADGKPLAWHIRTRHLTMVVALA